MVRSRLESIGCRLTAAVAGMTLLVGIVAVPAGAQGGTVPGDTTTTTTTTSTTVPASSTTLPVGPTTTVAGGAPTTTVPEGPDVNLPGVDLGELEDLLRGYDEAVSAEAGLLAQFELSVAQLEQLNSDLVGMNARMLEVENELLDAEARLSDAENRRHLAEVRLDDVSEELTDARFLFEQEAVEAYMFGGQTPGLAALTADSFDQVETTRQYASAVADHTTSVVERYATLQVEARSLEAQASEAQQLALADRDEVSDHKTALDEERLAHARAQADAFVAALAQQDLISQVEAQRGDYELRLRTLSGTSDSISGILDERQRGQSLPQSIDAIFLPPVEDPQIVSPFGPRLHPIFGTVRMHNGADIDGANGEPIRAAEDGEVVVADWRDGYGMTTVIDHGNGLATLYAHQSAQVVEVGEEVEMGDVIGLVGSTGWSTGPHIHWEVRVFGNPVDPIRYLGTDELLERRREERDPDGD